MPTGLKTYYQNLFQKFGATPKAVQHVSQASQYKRFEILTSVAPTFDSLIDVGCGLGDLAGFLIKKKFSGQYLGLDFVEGFIQFAKKKYKKNGNVKFREFDLKENEIPQAFDYVVLSGVFNNKTEESEPFMKNTIEKMFGACRKGVAFNAMSTYVDYCDSHLHYSNPLEIFDYCKRNLTRKVVLKHDYLVKENTIPFEYTMFLYRE